MIAQAYHPLFAQSTTWEACVHRALQSAHSWQEINFIFQEQERNAQMQMSGLQSDVGKLRADLTEADQHVEKLKEDIHLRENELSALREQTFNLQKLDEQFPILQAQVRQFNWTGQSCNFSRSACFTRRHVCSLFVIRDRRQRKQKCHF